MSLLLSLCHHDDHYHYHHLHHYYYHHYQHYIYHHFYFTDPQTPGAIQILRTTQTSITFAWGSAGGNFDLYSINLYPDGTQTAFLQDVPRGSDLTVSKNYLAPGTLYRIEIYAVTGTTKSALRDTTASTGKLILFGNLLNNLAAGHVHVRGLGLACPVRTM